MSTLKTKIGDTLAILDQTHAEVHEKLYHMLLCTIHDPFTNLFIRKGKERVSFLDEIVRQMIRQRNDNLRRSQAYYKDVDFLSNLDEKDIKAFNAGNEIFSLHAKDPGEKLKITVTLKVEALEKLFA